MLSIIVCLVSASAYLATVAAFDLIWHRTSPQTYFEPAVRELVYQQCFLVLSPCSFSPSCVDRLHLETLGPPSATSLLELSTLALDVWLLVLVGSHAEVLDGLSGVLWSSQQNNIATSRGSHGKLIKCQAFTTGLLNSSSSSRCESESSDGELWNDLESVIVCDGADDCDSLALIGLLSRLCADFAVNAGDGHGRSVYSRHEQSLEDDFVEVGIGSSCSSLVFLVLCACAGFGILTSKESVELDEQLQIWVVALGCLSVAVPNVMTIKIDT